MESAVFTFGGSLGFAVGPLAIIGVVQFLGLDRSYYIILPGLLGVLVLVVALQVPTGKIDYARTASLVEAFKGVQGPMALLFTVAVLREVTRLVIATFLPIVFAMQGRSLVAGGLTLSLFSLAGALGGMVGGALSDGWGRKRIIAGSGLLCVPFLYGVLHTEGLLALVCLALGAGTLSGANSVVIAMAQELVPSRAGTASSLVMGLGWGVAGIVLMGFGSLAEVIGVPRTLDLTMTVPLLAFGLSLWLPHHGALPHARVARVGEFALHEE